MNLPSTHRPVEGFGRRNGQESDSLGQTDRAGRHGVKGAAPIPMWVCLCGARNRLRDTACRNCGDHKP